MERTRYLHLLSRPQMAGRSRVAVLPDDVAGSDCWPDWSIAGTGVAQENQAGENAPRRVLFEAGLVLGVPLALAAVITLLAPVL